MGGKEIPYTLQPHAVGFFLLSLIRLEVPVGSVSNGPVKNAPLVNQWRPDSCYHLGSTSGLLGATFCVRGI